MSARHGFLALALAMLAGAAPAAADWPPEGKVVSDLTLVYGASPWYGSGPCELLLDADGGPVAITSASSGSSFYWNVARLDAHGDSLPGWPKQGRSLWGSLAGYNDRYHGVVISEASDVLFGYSHNLSKPSARRVTLAGTHEPDASTPGWAATTGSTSSGATDIAAGPEGTMYVAWDGRLQRLRSNGSVCTGWTSTGIVTVSGYRAAVLPDGTGGAIVVASDLGAAIRATRVDSNAVRHTGWPAGGRVLNTGTNPVFDFVSIRKPLVRADASHFVAGWNENLHGGSLRVQRFDLNGTVDPNWDPEGVLVCANDSLTSTMLVGDGQGGAWAGWEWRGRPYVAHVLADGSLVGGGGVSPLDAGAVYFTQTFRGNTPINAIAMDAAPDGGLFFAWSDGRRYGDEQVRFRRFTPDLLPSPAEPDTGRVVFTKPYDLICGCYVGNTRAIRSDGQGGVFVLRDLGAPFALHHVIPFAAVGVPPSPPRAGLLLRAPAPNPARDAITLRFSLPDARPAALTLFDVAGRTLRTAQASGAGEHVVRWGDAGALAPGLYLAQLRQGAEQRTARVVVTR